MQDKFITNEGIEIPLDGLSFSFTEENPRFKDSFWTNYTLPIECPYTVEFLRKIGQFSSLDNSKLKRFHDGIHIHEGKRRKGKIEILEFGTKSLKFQIDSGFENLPNFDKKLADLPLHNFEVPDIYQHANEVVEKSYPASDYNFPKLYTDEYNLDSEEWKYFDSMINNRVQEQGKAVKSFPRNRIEDGMDVYNKNIIHPMPYLLYVLRAGFKDAGFQLMGDILSDEHLLQRCIFTDKNYYTTGDQKLHKLSMFKEEVYLTERTPGGDMFGKWKKSVVIEAPGKYRIYFKVHNALKGANVNLYYGDKHVYSFGAGNQLQVVENLSFVLDVSEQDAVDRKEFVFEYYGYLEAPHLMDSSKKDIGLAYMEIRPMRQHTIEGNVIPYVFNFNRVNLKKSVPDMSFGDLVTIIKNWRNYDLTFDGSKAIMNLIRIDKSKEPEDFRAFEVENPIRKFTDKEYFHLKFPEVEGMENRNIFFNEKGYQLNPHFVPENTTEVTVNGFCLPMAFFRGANTAKAYKESSLMLVYYAGLDRDGDNHATNPRGLEGEECAEHLKPWYMNRLSNFSYKWTFIAEKNKIRKYDIRSEIFAYNKRHWIKSWVKNSISDKHYSIEIETETY